MPAHSVTLNKNELDIAGATIGDFAHGQLDYKSQPELVTIMSDASKDSLMVDYLVCVASRRGDVTTQEQRDHLRSKLDFMRGAPPPTPAQITKWQADHPFPRSVK